MAEKTQKIKDIFHKYDENGDGKLPFTEFFRILHDLNNRWTEENAEIIFQGADQDLSGFIDFDEFVDYLDDPSTIDKLYSLEADYTEEDAKEALMTKSYELRCKASKAVRQRGDKWRDLTWKQRLQEVNYLEKSASEKTEKRVALAPSHRPEGTMSLFGLASKMDQVADNNENQPEEQVESPPKSVPPARPISPNTFTSTFGGGWGNLGSYSKLDKQNFGIARMSQTELVEYSLPDDDLGFTGMDPEALAFRDYLKTAAGPLSSVNILRFIAKGTAGWVFLAEDKESGMGVAMKLIRMTQARTGVKEWYISKKMVEAGVENIVHTFESVFVLDRENCPAVVSEELKKAGPVPFYLCMVQDLMPWGTLEDLAKEGQLTPGIMFKALEDVSATLAGMHANRVQHRDVKPENIMMQMQDDVVVAAKLCDLGSAETGTDPQGCADDVRRFGVTLFSVATGEGWTSNRLIREDHDKLVARLQTSVASSTDKNMRALPDILQQILDGRGTKTSMQQVADIMKELSAAY